MILNVINKCIVSYFCLISSKIIINLVLRFQFLFQFLIYFMFMINPRKNVFSLILKQHMTELSKNCLQATCFFLAL